MISLQKCNNLYSESSALLLRCSSESLQFQLLYFLTPKFIFFILMFYNFYFFVDILYLMQLITIFSFTFLIMIFCSSVNIFMMTILKYFYDKFDIWSLSWIIFVAYFFPSVWLYFSISLLEFFWKLETLYIVASLGMCPLSGACYLLVYLFITWPHYFHEAYFSPSSLSLWCCTSRRCNFACNYSHHRMTGLGSNFWFVCSFSMNTISH